MTSGGTGGPAGGSRAWVARPKYTSRAAVLANLDALRLTFERRGTHDLPADLIPPPADWQIPFRALAEECGLPADVAAVFAGVQEFLEEVLAQRIER